MKNLMVVLLLLAVIQGFGQRKKNKTDPKDQQIDTLTKANSKLSGQLDSVTKKYNGMYTTIKDKLHMNDFNPDKLPQIIDSIRATRDSSSFLQSAPLKDSLSQLNKKNRMLKAQLDSMDVAFKKQAFDATDKSKLMTELKDLKTLLDNKIITQADFDTKKKLIMDKWQ